MAETRPSGMDRSARVMMFVGLALAPVLGIGVVYTGEWLLGGLALITMGLMLLSRPIWGVYGLLFGTFFDSVTIKTSFAALGLGDLSALALIGTWLAHRLINPRGIRLPERSGLLACYFLLGFASLAAGVSPQSALGGYARLLTYGVTLIAVVDLVRDIEVIERITIIMALCSLIHAVVGMGFMGDINRMSGLIQQPNLLGVLIALGTFPMAGWIIRTQRKRVRVLLVGALLLMALGIVLTISRGTYIAVSLAFLWWIRRSVQLALALVLALTGTYFAMSQFAEDRMDRIETRLEFQDSSVVNRGIVARNALRTIAEAPLLGVGLGQMEHAHDAVEITQEVGRGSHSFYMGTAASTGIPALLFILGFLFAQFRRINIGLRNARARTVGFFRGEWVRYEWSMALFQTLMIYHSASLVVRGGQRLMEWTFFSLYAAIAAVAVNSMDKKSAPESDSVSPPVE